MATVALVERNVERAEMIGEVGINYTLEWPDEVVEGHYNSRELDVVTRIVRLIDAAVVGVALDGELWCRLTEDGELMWAADLAQSQGE